MIVSFFLLVGHVDANEVRILALSEIAVALENYHLACLDIVHFRDLLLIGILRFTLAVVKCRLGLFPPVFYLLTRPVVPSLLLSQVAVRTVSIPFQFDGIFGVTLSQLFISGGENAQRFGNLGQQLG